jgi:hypothetical protein
MDQLDPLYLALFYFRLNRLEDAHRECAKLLERNPLDQAAWSLKLACFAEEVYVDELENDEAGLADAYMDLGTTVMLNTKEMPLIIIVIPISVGHCRQTGHFSEQTADRSRRWSKSGCSVRSMESSLFACFLFSL